MYEFVAPLSGSVSNGFPSAYTHPHPHPHPLTHQHQHQHQHPTLKTLSMPNASTTRYRTATVPVVVPSSSSRGGGPGGDPEADQRSQRSIRLDIDSAVSTASAPGPASVSVHVASFPASALSQVVLPHVVPIPGLGLDVDDRFQSQARCYYHSIDVDGNRDSDRDAARLDVRSRSRGRGDGERGTNADHLYLCDGDGDGAGVVDSEVQEHCVSPVSPPPGQITTKVSALALARDRDLTVPLTSNSASTTTTYSRIDEEGGVRNCSESIPALVVSPPHPPQPRPTSTSTSTASPERGQRPQQTQTYPHTHKQTQAQTVFPVGRCNNTYNTLDSSAINDADSSSGATVPPPPPQSQDTTLSAPAQYLNGTEEPYTADAMNFADFTSNFATSSASSSSLNAAMLAHTFPPNGTTSTSTSNGHALSTGTAAHMSNAADWRQPNDDEELTQAGRTALLKADMMYMHEDDDVNSYTHHGHWHREHQHASTSQTQTQTQDERAQPHARERTPSPEPILTWDPALDAADRAREARADAADFAHGAGAGAGAHSHSSTNLNGNGNARGAGVYTGYAGAGMGFQMDRKVIRDLVREKFGGVEVVRVRFLSSGTFHKAYLLTLNTPVVPPPAPLTPTSQAYANPKTPPPPPPSYASSSSSSTSSSSLSNHPKPTPTRTLVARIARRFMPRLKTRSEVATLSYLREHTSVPVPVVYYVDENPYARVGGELVVMSEAPGIPLARVYHSLPHAKLVALLRNLAEMVIPIFGHRFSMIGSLYEGAGEGVLGPTDPLAPERNIATGTGKGVAEDALVYGSSLPTPKPSSSIVPSFGSTPRMSRCPTIVSLNTLAVRNALEAAKSSAIPPVHPSTQFHVGPIISWPFFGSHRGELSHTAGLGFPPQPPEIDRGPWRSTRAYLEACAAREIEGAKRENEGKAKPHRLHLDPDERVRADRRGRRKKARGRLETYGEEQEGGYVWGYGYVGSKGIRAFGHGDASSDSSDDEDGDGSGSASPGSTASSLSTSPVSSLGLNSEDSDEDAMYRDYRRYQRNTFLVAHLQRREAVVRGEMERIVRCVEGLQRLVGVQLGVMGVRVKGLGVRGLAGASAVNGVVGPLRNVDEEEEFSLDCHDLSLENVFVDAEDHTKITCVIDWESTTTRPLWQCAHLPSFLLSSPFTSNLFRKIVSAMARGETYKSGHSKHSDAMECDSTEALTDLSPEAEARRAGLALLATQWLALERVGGSLRYAHKCVEWDGWEEGLVPSILGELDDEDDESVPEHEREEPLVKQVRAAIEAELEVLENEKRKAEKKRQRELEQSLHEQDGEDHEHDHDHDDHAREGERRLSPVPARKSGTTIPALNVAATVSVVPPFGIGKSKLEVPGGAGFRRGSTGETERERMLDTDGDLCGGVGGELGRRLEAWLVENHVDYGYDGADEREVNGKS